MRSLGTAFAFTLLCAAPAFAVWPAQGKFVMMTFDSPNGTSHAELVTLPTGELVLRGSGVGGNSFGYSFQKLSAQGDLAPLWPADGAAISEVSKTIQPVQAGWAVDSAGTLWSTGFGVPSVNRVSRDGVFLGGTTLSSTNTIGTMPVSFIPGPNHLGVYGFFGNRLQRILANGSIAAGWPATGALMGIGGNGMSNSLLPVGNGGVLAMVGFPLPRIQRMDSTGVRHAGWPSTGIALTNDVVTTPDFGEQRGLPRLIPSGDHVLALWASPFNAPQSIMAQRVSYEGVRDANWPPEGNLIVPSDSLLMVDVRPDGASGAYVLWYAHGAPYAAHVLADGTVYTAPLTRPGDLYSYPRRSSTIAEASGPIPAGVTASGGLAFAWDEGPTGAPIRVRWFRPDLTLEPSAPAEGRVIGLNTSKKENARAVHGAPDGGVYVVWEQGTERVVGPGESVGELWMTRLDPTPIGAGVTPTGNPLALSAPRPNPARGSTSFELTLPDDSPAQLQLLDLAGRVVQSRTVSGAGRHAVTFDALGRVSPGLYFVRASARSGVSTSRVVVSH